MSTVATITNRAARLLGVLGSGESLGTNEAAEALVALNARIDSFRNEGLMTYSTQTESLTLSASTASYTIGPGGTLNTTRPVLIEEAWIVDSDISYPVRLITDHQYDTIADKTTTSSWPEYANYRPTMSTGTLYVYPLPNATRTLKLRTRVVVSAYAATTDSVTLPPGWEDVLATDLAITLAAEYEMEPPAVVVELARRAKAGVKRMNSKPLIATTELGWMYGYHHPNIEADLP